MSARATHLYAAKWCVAAPHFARHVLQRVKQAAVHHGYLWGRAESKMHLSGHAASCTLHQQQLHCISCRFTGEPGETQCQSQPITAWLASSMMRCVVARQRCSDSPRAADRTSASAVREHEGRHSQLATCCVLCVLDSKHVVCFHPCLSIPAFRSMPEHATTIPLT